MAADSAAEYPNDTYDQLVYYVAPVVLVGAILFCFFRLALLYYIQTRPRGQRVAPTMGSQSLGRSVVELEAASNAYPSVYREIFLRAPPPTYDDTMKNDRRGGTGGGGRSAVRRAQSMAPAAIQSPQPVATTDASRSLRHSSSTISLPDVEFGPPAYAQFRSQSIETLDSVAMSQYARRRLRLPSYEEVIHPNEREPTERQPG